jgi:hypothetical protein
MLHSSYCGALLTFSIFTILPFGQGQSVFSLPQCVQNCISQSQDDNCQITDIKCLCRASSAGNFLPGLITCTHAECDNTFDNDLLLTPLQLVCEIAGIPIPASALANAENQASSLAHHQLLQLLERIPLPRSHLLYQQSRLQKLNRDQLFTKSTPLPSTLEEVQSHRRQPTRKRQRPQHIFRVVQPILIPLRLQRRPSQERRLAQVVLQRVGQLQRHLLIARTAHLLRTRMGIVL